MPDYPGFGLPLRHNQQADDGSYPIGAHGSCDGAHTDLIQIRELAMLSIMDTLTDKDDWHKKVFDDAIVAKWRVEAKAIPDVQFKDLATGGKRQYWDRKGKLELMHDSMTDGMDPPEGIMSDNTFDCIIQELRSKAKYYEQSKLIPTLDACASVAKSDKLVSPALQESLQKAFRTLKEAHESAPDWHPRSNEMVQNLVHPSMYPLVYGRSRAIKEEVVGVDDAVEKWAGKGEVLPEDDWRPDANRDRHRYGVGTGDVPPQYWSSTYQWLPSNVAFQADGTVRFTSYINNLHPNRYPEIYRTIEKLIETALPAWDQCLALASGYVNRYGAGRTEVRIPYPDDPDDENPENWIPSDRQAFVDVEVDWEEAAIDFHPGLHDEVEKKWELFRKPFVPEPAFTDIEYGPEPGLRLAEKFAESGLQVIVKMASIELTPEKPEFPAGGWHIEGQMNEHIVATALYYLDSENVSSSSLFFRMQTSAYLNEEISVGQHAYHWLEQIYGTGLSPGNSPCLQNYGSVETRQGRLLAFPNVFQHRVSPFHLEDPTKPGHRRFIALWLVNPNRRIISTANVPPQQLDWWVDAVFGRTKEARDAAASKLPAEIVTLIKDRGLDMSVTDGGSLPPELMDMVRLYSEREAVLPMGAEEAREHRLKLMDERTAFVKQSEDDWQLHSYSFCEH